MSQVDDEFQEITHFDWKLMIIVLAGLKTEAGVFLDSPYRRKKNDEYIVQPVICIKIVDKTCFSTIELFR